MTITAAQLVEAVREFLERDVLDAVDGRVRFHTRVAINALGIVERELEQTPTRAAAPALGFEDDAALASAIRAGELDERWTEVVAAVRADLAEQLAVNNPGYEDPG